jgi:diketogulonate reductase-like aldo/keto reductase
MSDAPSPEVDLVELRRGSLIPILGFGTSRMTGGAASDAVVTALELGYRHLDTATLYGNERDVGRALAESGLPREALFVTTKLPGNARSVRQTIERSLSDLRLDYVDLWLLHWPPARSFRRPLKPSRRMYEEMLVLRDEGLIRAVGVSNFSTKEIDELITATGESPEVNQIPWSPFRYDASTRCELDERNIRLEGYSPIVLSRLAEPALAAIASLHGVTAVQVVLRWHVQHGVIVLAKSARRERIRENFDLFGFALDQEEMTQLDRLSTR